ncbi:MAG: tRNA (N6-isopentenyl adenosine(37)-C2)-methylthiotransferase MiaB [Psychrilyobacter sp.]|nr:tRNA (N6-isopentenyl adenosine(37)-C2)-methylthiotransferase MiaB [Psychrilyobacter sp.]
MNRKKATIVTYGCQMNVNETAKMKKLLEENGYDIIDDIHNSDAVFLNTCTVRGGAAGKIEGKLGNLKTIKNSRNGNLIIGVTGCVAQEEKEHLLKRAPYIDIVLGNQNISQLPEIMEKILDGEIEHAVLTNNEDELPPRIDANFGDGITASVAINYGCNNFCTYCIVPYVRGRERSVPLEDIVADVRQYIKKGYKDILLLGQNVNSYGQDFTESSEIKFSKLLDEICKIDGDYWIRYVSPHPKDLTTDVLEIMAKYPEKIASNMHLPVQSGSTEILKKMNRKYTKENYLKLVDNIKDILPNISLTTDIIVGFPGETEENFLDTLDVVRKVQYENAYMFKYSIREGTPAATMEGQIPEDVKQERLLRLMEVQNESAKNISLSYVGKTVKVLVEGPSRRNEEKMTGRISENKVVIFKGDHSLKGTFVKVKIVTAKTWTLYGELV